MSRTTAVVLLALVVLVAPSCTAVAPTIIGSGNAVTEQRTVGSFTKVRVDDAIKATVIVGPDITVSVTTDDNVLPDVSTTVTLGRLKVSMQGSAQPKTPVTVSITMPSLDDIGAGSASNVIATGVNSTSVSATADSAATLVVRGNADSVAVTASDAASADLGNVPAQSATVNVGSGAHATVNAQQSVSGSVDAGGVVTIEGNPPTVNVSSATGGAVVRD
jgi:Putative auto-transporter adhesin, head GIN domain